MRVVQLFQRAAAAAVVVLLVTAGSCGSDDPAIEDVIESLQSTDQQSSDTTVSEAASEGRGDFQTVFGIPPFGSATVDPNFGAYAETTDDFQTRQWVFFELAGATRDQAVDHYIGTLTAAGYEVGQVPAGGSTVLSLSMPPDTTLSGVVQIGPISPSDPTLGINQERIMLKPTDRSTTEDAPVESVESEAIAGDTADDAN